MDIVNRDNARRLIGAAAGIGVAITWNRAAELINNFGSVARAIAYIRRRIAAEREHVQWQIRQGEQAARLREEARMEIVTEDRMHAPNANTEVPLHDDFGPSAVVAVGDHALFTKSRRRVRVPSSRHRSKLSRVIPDTLFRWQSIFAHTAAQGGTADSKSLILASVVGADSTGGNTVGLAMPMFAFDLSSPVVQGQSDSNNPRSFREKVAIPVYRLFKNVTGGSLSVGTANYVWKAQKGLANSPTSNSSFYTPQYEYIEEPYAAGGSQYIESFRIKYSALDLMFKASRTNACRIHVQTVKFKNGAGPLRSYCTYPSYNIESLPTAVDQALDAESQSSVDVFWESFWSSKVTHPLCNFKNNKRSNYIQVLSDDVINVRPEDSVQSTPFQHLKSLLFTDGRWRYCRSAQVQDAVGGSNAPPVTSTYVNGACRFDKNSNYSVTARFDSHQLFQNEQKAIDNTVYALVWMESYECADVLPQNIQNGQTFDTFVENLTNPSSGAYSNILAQTAVQNCCGFDVRFRKRVEHVLAGGV